jgi:C1A family cysteine protease
MYNNDSIAETLKNIINCITQNKHMKNIFLFNFIILSFFFLATMTCLAQEKVIETITSSSSVITKVNKVGDTSNFKVRAIELEGSNVTPYQPVGWDNKIVLSTISGTNTSASTIYDNQIIYLDWAVINNGSLNITQTFYSSLYIDGNLQATYSTPGLASGYYAYITDASIGPLTAGSHTFKIVVDVNSNVSETNESDNEYSISRSITSSVCVNLTPYQPTGWDDKIVLSTLTGTNVSSATIFDNQTLYLDWALINNGSYNISPTFYSKLYIDGVLQSTYNTLGLNSNSYSYVTDIPIGPLSAGLHTFKIVVDANNDVSETNENDNEYTLSKNITASVCVNLVPYRPAGWDDKIVLSTVTGTNTSASTIYDNQMIYLDWAVINDGLCNISQTFYSKLYIDGVLKTTYSTSGLNSGYFSYVTDEQVGSLSAGSHTFKIVVDANANVTESNESDNEYTITKSILIHPSGNIKVVPTSLTISQSTSSMQPGQATEVEKNNEVKPHYDTLNHNLQISGFQNHGRGIVVPSFVTTYWETHESPVLKVKSPRANQIVDWSSQDSPVKAQLCGSCWAYAAVGLIENLGIQTDLSEQAVISCNAAGDNCSGGWPWNALAYAQSTGVPPESCYPSESGNGTCSNVCSNPSFRERVTSFTSGMGLWGEIATVDNLKSILNNGPAVVTMIVPTDQSFDLYTGGIYNYNGSSIPWDKNAHAVLCVGYDDNQQCFKVKNSWGSSWGESGYFRIAYDDVTDYVHFGGYAVQASGVYTQYLTENIVTISNIGTGILHITSITDNKDWLTTSEYPNTPFSMSPNGSQNVSLSVNWALVGTSSQTAVITISSDDPDEPLVTVQVTVVPLSCTPPSAPQIGLVTQPTCSVSTGSVVLKGLPASWDMDINKNPGSSNFNRYRNQYNNIRSGSRNLHLYSNRCIRLYFWFIRYCCD